MDYIFYLLYTFIFLLGLCLGSFLNCVIYRLESEKSLNGRSFCPRCKHKLSWQDLFPVFSFLFLKGKCRYCREKISIQYPLVEFITGLIFLVIFWKFGIKDLFALCLTLYVSCSLIAIFIYDLKHYLIPDKILFPAIVITFLYRLLANFSLMPNYIIAVLVSAGFFLFIFLISKGRWMGFGDVKLAVLMGLLLGLPNVLVALFLAFLFGAIIGVILMAFGKKSAGWRMKSEMPFGPFLITGTFISILWASPIIQWYLNLFTI